jgi:hypothetical protein
MKTPQQPELLAVLAELWRRYPAWRFGQLIANVAGWADQDVWDVEDEHLVDAAREHLRALAQRRQEVTAPGE